MKTKTNKLPSGLYVEKWFTKKTDLPSSYTNELFLVKMIDVNTKEEYYSISMFIYTPVRKPIDYDEWRMICGARCYARYSGENLYNVVAWGKLKINKDDE